VVLEYGRKPGHGGGEVWSGLQLTCHRVDKSVWSLDHMWVVLDQTRDISMWWAVLKTIET
jgi:hypothetical protein